LGAADLHAFVPFRRVFGPRSSGPEREVHCLWRLGFVQCREAQLLRDRIGEPADSFAGQGKGGETSGDGLGRLGQILTEGLYPNAQALLYWEGGDDIVEFVRNRDPLLALSPDDPDYPYAAALEDKLDQVQAHIEQAIQTAQNAGLKVYVATYYSLKGNESCRPLPTDFLLDSQADTANAYVPRLNERIRRAARNRNAVLVDVASVAETLRQDPANYIDCNHLSSQGNAAVAGLFAAAIRP
jgi:lysophospholipase L1-like esterase